MKRKDILKMPAGKEINDLISAHVFNRIVPYLNADYSGDITAAWYVVNLLSSSQDWDEHPFDIHRNYTHSNMWTACFDDYRVQADAETPALAICRAALLAVMEFEDGI